MWVEFSEWVTDMKIYVSHVNTHQRLTSAEKDCDNQVDDKTLLGDTSQPLSTAPLSSPSELTKWPWWQAWRLYISSATWTSTRQGQPGYGHQ